MAFPIKKTAVKHEGYDRVSIKCNNEFDLIIQTARIAETACTGDEIKPEMEA